MKKTLTLLLALVCAVTALGGCDKQQNETDPTETNVETVNATEATEPSAEITTPSTEATEPSTQATEPTTQATEPTTQATEPPTQATEPPSEAPIEQPETPRLLINGAVCPEITNIIFDYTSYKYKCALIPFEAVINELGGTVTWKNENVLSYTLDKEYALDIRTCDFGTPDSWDGDTPVFTSHIAAQGAAYSEVCKKIDGVLMIDTFTFGSMLYPQDGSAWVNWEKAEVNVQL